MNVNKLFLLIMLTGACSVAHAAANNPETIRIRSLNQDPESGVFFVGEDVDVKLRQNSPRDPIIFDAWLSLCYKLKGELTLEISIYDAGGERIETFLTEEREGPYDPDTMYFARSRAPHIEIADINGLNIKGDDE